MPRRREVPKREILPDPKFNDRMVAKFINNQEFFDPVFMEKSL